MKEFLKGKKTYILSFLAFLAALLPVLTGEVGAIEFLTSPEAKELIWALIPAAMRAGISKK